jgi:hypothetical protein
MPLRWNPDAKAILEKAFFRDPGLNFLLMLDDIRDFLTFSERNIESQFIVEQEAIQKRDIEDEFQIKDENLAQLYTESLLKGTQRRFTIALPTQIRYAALSAMTSAVDWTAHFYQQSWKSKLPKELRNPVITAISLLKYFDTVLSLNRADVLADYRHIVVVRNAVVHGGGIVYNFNKKEDLKKAVKHLKGFSIVNREPVGDCIQIDRHALDPYIDDMLRLLHRIYLNETTEGL